MPVTALPDDVRTWYAGGEHRQVLDRRIFVRDTGGPGTPIVIVHGFPGSSHDWARVVPVLAVQRRVVAFDLPGYGASEKTPGASYTLFRQADVVEALLGDLGIRRCVVVAHDMGDTVTAELLARRRHGRLDVEVEQVVLTNGSIFIDQAALTRGQRLTLRLPARALPFPLPTAILRRSLAESFAPGAPAPVGAIEAMIASIRHDRGDRLLPVLIRYIEERRRHQARWTEALVAYDGPLALLWGEQDPIAVLAMAHRLADLRPGTAVRTFADLGHWLSLEAPDLLAGAILAQLEGPGVT
ncbi:MAG: alpha/beta hydrolase [Nocardioides sp.]